jgi:hypothetical protein
MKLTHYGFISPNPGPYMEHVPARLLRRMTLKFGHVRSIRTHQTGMTPSRSSDPNFAIFSGACQAIRQPRAG